MCFLKCIRLIFYITFSIMNATPRLQRRNSQLMVALISPTMVSVVDTNLTKDTTYWWHIIVLDYWFPQALSTQNICGATLKTFCEDFIKKSKSYFTLSWVAVAIIMVGLTFCLMSMSGILSDNSARNVLNEIRRYFLNVILYS